VIELWISEVRPWSAVHSAEDAATVVEYGVLVALIAGVVIGVIAIIGGSLLSQLIDFVNAWP
jgi:Flp pilus assembly pilin Flp